MSKLPRHLVVRLPFLVAGFASFLFSVYLYFVADETTAGIFVGLWVPSIHSLGTLLITPVHTAARDLASPVQA
ncbi:MAG: hypothetical protein ACSLFO_00240 [Acidimicrobiales bacterium]